MMKFVDTKWTVGTRVYGGFFGYGTIVMVMPHLCSYKIKFDNFEGAKNLSSKQMFFGDKLAKRSLKKVS
jgi:hypothetical protein